MHLFYSNVPIPFKSIGEEWNENGIKMEHYPG
jgi:hypothetical protein